MLAHIYLQAALGALALVAFVTGLLMLIVGATSLPTVTNVPTTVDNELRFYSAYWLAYGAMNVWIAQDLTARKGWVLCTAPVMLLSGMGRLISYLVVGPPEATMFIPIMYVELVFPFTLILAAQSLGSSHRASTSTKQS